MTSKQFKSYSHLDKKDICGKLDYVTSYNNITIEDESINILRITCSNDNTWLFTLYVDQPNKLDATVWEEQDFTVRFYYKDKIVKLYADETPVYEDSLDKVSLDVNPSKFK